MASSAADQMGTFDRCRLKAELQTLFRAQKLDVSIPLRCLTIRPVRRNFPFRNLPSIFKHQVSGDCG
jgi:hypothetical protein